MSNGLEGIQFKATRLSDQVTEALKKVIEDRTFKVGDTLPTVEKIAAQFKVSKVTVREALRALEAEELIEIRRGASGGIYIRQPCPDRIRDSVLHAWRFGGLSPAELTEFRQIIEPGISELAAVRRTDEDIEALRANLDYCEKAIGYEEKSKLGIHLEFHRLLANACHNRLISVFMEAVTKVHEDMFRELPLTLELGIQDLEYNKKFIDCLVDRDKDRIRKLMVSHFDMFKEFVDSLQRQSEENS